MGLQYWCSREGRITSSLALLPDPLWPGMVIPIRIQSASQINLFELISKIILIYICSSERIKRNSSWQWPCSYYYIDAPHKRRRSEWKKKLNGNCKRILRAILNKSWKQHPTKQQLYSQLLPISKTIEIRRIRHTGHCWRNRGDLISYVLVWAPSQGVQMLEVWLELIDNSSLQTQDVVYRTCRMRWSIETNKKGESWKSVLTARHDDDDGTKYEAYTRFGFFDFNIIPTIEGYLMPKPSL